MEYWKKAALIAGVGTWSDTMDTAAGLLIFGLVTKEWGIGAALAGLSTTISRLVAVPIHGLFSGILTDIFGRKKLFIFGNFVTGLSFVALSLATDIWTWTIAYIPRIWSIFLTGIAGVFVIEEIPSERRGWYYGLTRVFGVLGGLSASLGLSVFSLLGYGWRAVLLFDAALNFFAAILALIFLKESTVWQERMNLIKEGKIPKKEKLPLRKVIQDPEIRARFLVAGWVMLFMNFTRVGDWFGSIYQTQTLHFDAVIIGYLGTISTLMGVIPGPLLGRISDAIGRVKTIVLALILAVITTILWFQTDTFVGVGVTVPVLIYFIIFRILSGIFLTGFNNVVTLWQNELYPTSLRATLSSWNYLFYAVPDILLPSFVGIYAGLMGLGYASAIFLSIGILTIIPVILGRKRFETKAVKITATD